MHIYTRRASDIKPTTPRKDEEPPENTELTLVKTSDRHVGFTIEFNPKMDSPKMSKKESLQDFVPVTVKNKINENKRIVEELKAERLSKKGDDPDSLQVGYAHEGSCDTLLQWHVTPHGHSGICHHGKRRMRRPLYTVSNKSQIRLK